MCTINNFSLFNNDGSIRQNAYSTALSLALLGRPTNTGRSTILGGDSNSSRNFNYKNELNNIKTILNTNFQENVIHRKTIPAKSTLNINQGVYLDCACLIVDIRNSSDLTNIHTKQKLAKLYQTFISTTIMIMQDETNCADVKIIGDGVQGFFNTNTKDAYENILLTAARINSFTKLMNKEFNKNDITSINIGIGISCGSVLMTKAGRGQKTDIIWIGDAVNEASHLCDIANKELNAVVISYNFSSLMPQQYIEYFNYNMDYDCFHSNLVSKEIENFCANCK